MKAILSTWAMMVVLMIGLNSCIKETQIPDSPVDFTVAKDIAEMQKMALAIFLEIDDVIKHEDTLAFTGPGADPASCIKGQASLTGGLLYVIDFGNTQCGKIWNTQINGKCSLYFSKWTSNPEFLNVTSLDLTYKGKIIRGTMGIGIQSTSSNPDRITGTFFIKEGKKEDIIYSFNIGITLIKGENTATLKDNTYLLTPIRVRINDENSRPKNFYSSDGSDTLLLDVACGGYPLSGSMLIDNYDNEIPGTLDFGTGTCDNIGSWIFQNKPNELVFE